MKSKKTIGIIIIILSVLAIGIVVTVGFMILKNNNEDNNTEDSIDSFNTVMSFQKNEELKSTDFNQLYDLNNELLNIQDKYLDDEGFIAQEKVESVLIEIADFLELNKDTFEIETFRLNIDSENIYIKFKSGISHIFSPRQKDFLSSGNENTIVTIHPQESDWRTKFAVWDANLNKNKLEYQGDYTLKGIAEMIADNVNSYNYLLNSSAENRNVTVDFAKKLSGNKIIIWQGHGAYDEVIGSCLIIGEKVSISSFPYCDDLIEGRIITYGGWFDNISLGLTPEFFNHYYNENDFRESLVYLGACYSGKDIRLSDSMNKTEKGTIISYSDKVDVTYEILMRTTFFYNLIKKDYGEFWSAGQAYEMSQIWRSKSGEEMLISGNLEFRLSEDIFEYEYDTIFLNQVKNDFTLTVYNSAKLPHLNYNLKIEKVITETILPENPRENLDDIKSYGDKESIFNENIQIENKELYLENGTYILTITDITDNTNKKTVKLNVSDFANAVDKVDIYTDFPLVGEDESQNNDSIQAFAPIEDNITITKSLTIEEARELIEKYFENTLDPNGDIISIRAVEEIKIDDLNVRFDLRVNDKKSPNSPNVLVGTITVDLSTGKAIIESNFLIWDLGYTEIIDLLNIPEKQNNSQDDEISEHNEIYTIGGFSVSIPIEYKYNSTNNVLYGLETALFKLDSANMIFVAYGNIINDLNELEKHGERLTINGYTAIKAYNFATSWTIANHRIFIQKDDTEFVISFTCRTGDAGIELFDAIIDTIAIN